jgi:hypothetical protein
MTLQNIVQVLGSEEALVNGITEPGGLRPLPDAADLRRFVDTLGSMDGLRTAELLRDRMVRGQRAFHLPSIHTCWPSTCVMFVQHHP